MKTSRMDRMKISVLCSVSSCKRRHDLLREIHFIRMAVLKDGRKF